MLESNYLDRALQVAYIDKLPVKFYFDNLTPALCLPTEAGAFGSVPFWIVSILWREREPRDSVFWVGARPYGNLEGLEPSLSFLRQFCTKESFGQECLLLGTWQFWEWKMLKLSRQDYKKPGGRTNYRKVIQDQWDRRYYALYENPTRVIVYKKG